MHTIRASISIRAKYWAVKLGLELAWKIDFGG